MKFLKYLNRVNSGDPGNALRSASIQLTDKKSIDLPKSDISERLNDLLRLANKTLKGDYSGSKYKFALVLDEENKIEKLPLQEEKKLRIRKRWMEFNDSLAQLQREFEEKLK